MTREVLLVNDDNPNSVAEGTKALRSDSEGIRNQPRTERLCFVIDAGTDIRLVDGLHQRFDLAIVARKIQGGVEISQSPSYNIELIVGPASRFSFAKYVLKFLLRESFDFVIVQGYGATALAANIAGRLNGTATAMLVCSPVEAYYRCRKLNPEPEKVFRAIELVGARLVARLNAIIGMRYFTLSNHLLSVVRSYGKRLPVSVIPVYGVDTEIFIPATEPRVSIRQRLNLPTTGSLIFFSSRIAPEKDSETLLSAFKQLLDSGRDLWLLHRSGGYEKFVKEARAFGVDARIIATDAVHPHRQLPLDYQASDLCVQASREEGLGFSPLEALACGVPVVATDVGGLRETIIDGETGWTYPVGNSEALARCIEDALDNSIEVARRVDAGRKLVLGKYDRQFVFDQLVHAIHLVTERRSGSRSHERSRNRFRQVE